MAEPPPHFLMSRRRVAKLVSAACLPFASPSIAAADCLPPDLRADAPQAEQADITARTRAPAASLFVDVSGSMAGFVNPAVPAPARAAAEPPAPRVFRDLVLTLPQLASAVADRFDLYAFGQTIRPLKQADLVRAAHSNFYADQDSRIQDALERMDRLPTDELGVLITDLFLTGEEIFGGAAAIRAPLARILQSGRTIGLVGIRSGFAGTVYDIPGVKSYAGATERPFFLLICGPAASVARFSREIESELLTPLLPPADGQARYHIVLFTQDPIKAGQVFMPMRPIAPAQAADMLAPDLGQAVSRVGFPAGQGSAVANLEITSLAAAGTLLPDEFVAHERLFASPRRIDAAGTCAESWIAIQSLAGLAQLAGDSGSQQLVVGGPVLRRATPGVVFVLAIELIAVGLSGTPAKTAWTRAWNLEAREAESYVASKPKMFRTLNLREIVVMLEDLVRTTIVPKPVGRSVLAFQIPRP